MKLWFNKRWFKWLLTGQKAQLKSESIFLEWTDIYDFTISSNKHWLPGGGENALGDPNSPFSYSNKLATGRD